MMKKKEENISSQSLLISQSRYGFSTKAVHDVEKNFYYNPSSIPIYQTSTFFFDSIDEAAEVARGEKDGFLYTRISNPTIKAFEEKMALLEEGEAAVTFASGMAALAAAMFEILHPGDEIISCSQIYAGSRNFFQNILKKIGCKINYFSPDENLRDVICSLINERTRAIFFESPSNPELSIIDIKLVASIAKRNGLISIIDNTFATPYLQKPIIYGIDCVIHSATKYIGGHGDAIGGIVVSSGEFISRIRRNMLVNLGACLSPFNAWLFLKGLKTLHVRMEHHCNSALKIAEFLDGHSKVKKVLYPGLKKHPGYQIAKKQMSGHGGMVSFLLEDRKTCKKFLDGLELCRIGVSLGDTETIVLNSALMFHTGLSDQECINAGIRPNLIRISTGLEDPNDIIKDIGKALDRL